VKNVLVIGGSYFVGRVFVEELSKVPGYAIYVMNRGNVPLNMEGITEIRCDRHDTEAMCEAIPSIMWSAVVDFCAYTPEDIAMMISILPSHATGHYVYISTASVYEKTQELPVQEDAAKVTGPQPGPHGDYAYKKYLAEEELKRGCREGNIPWTIFRPAFIYGKYNYAPRESYFFDLMEDGKTIILPDKELALFTFVAVWDVARAIIKCIGNQDAYAKAYNLSSEELVSYQRLMEVLRIVTDKPIRTEAMSVEKIEAQGIPLPFPLDEHLVYSGTRITKDMGFSYMPFLEGMRATYAWYSQIRGERYEEGK
jgi:nucleoside-diphosphate-sugar epimerase